MRDPQWSSTEWEEFYQDSSAFIIFATIHYANGSAESFMNDDFVDGSFSYTEHSCGVSSFSIDEVISVESHATLNNRGNRIGYRDFQNARITYQLRLTNDRVLNNNHDLSLHTLTITNVEYRGEYIELTAMDNLSAMDGRYTVSTTKSSKTLAQLGWQVTSFGRDHTMSFDSVLNTNTLTIPTTTFNPPISVREYLSACAEIAGCITVMKNGINDDIDGIPFPIYDFTDDLDGGSFDYDDGDFAYGGEFNGSIGQNKFPIYRVTSGYIPPTTVYGNGIVWNYNPDGTVVANGTAITDCIFELTAHFTFPTYQDVMTISSGRTDGSRSTYFLYGTVGNDSSDAVGFDSVTTNGNAFDGNEGIINTGGYTKFGSLYLQICAGVTVNNVVFAPSVMIQSHTNAMSLPWGMSTTTNLGVTFTPQIDSYKVTGTATGNYPQVKVKEGMLLSPGTYTIFDYSNSVYTGLGIFFYNNSSMTTKYSGESTGLHSDSSSVYVYTTTDGELTTSSNFGVKRTFTITQQAYVRVKGYTVGTGYTGSLNATIIPYLIPGEWETTNRAYFLQNHNLFFNKTYQGTYRPNALPYWECRNGEHGFVMQYDYIYYDFDGTAYTDLVIPLSEDFYVPEGTYVMKANYYLNGHIPPVFRLINNETGEVIYEGTSSTVTLTMEEGYYSGYLLIEQGVYYWGDIRPSIMTKKQSETLGGADEYWDGGWTTLPAYDGGLFVFWRTNRTVIRKDDAYPLIKIMQNPIVSPTMITVSGVEVSGEGINTVRVGTEGYVIKIQDNPLITTQAIAQSAAELCLSNMEGVSFIPFSISNSANPRLEPGDMVIFQDVNGNDIVTFPTGIDYHLGNLTTANMIEQNANENAKFSSEE